MTAPSVNNNNNNNNPVLPSPALNAADTIAAAPVGDVAAKTFVEKTQENVSWAWNASVVNLKAAGTAIQEFCKKIADCVSSFFKTNLEALQNKVTATLDAISLKLGTRAWEPRLAAANGLIADKDKLLADKDAKIAELENAAVDDGEYIASAKGSSGWFSGWFSSSNVNA